MSHNNGLKAPDEQAIQGLIPLVNEQGLQIKPGASASVVTPAENPLVVSGREFADDLEKTVPGMSRVINHQTAAVQWRLTRLSAAEEAAALELAFETKRLQDRRALIQQRQPEYLKERERLEMERAPKRLLFARSAALLGVVLAPDALSVEGIVTALRQETNDGKQAVPVPEPSTRAGQITLSLAHILAPFFCSIPISFALLSLVGIIPISTLQNLDNLSSATMIILFLFWLIGIALHHLVMGIGTHVGIHHARAKFEGYTTGLPEKASVQGAAWCGTLLLVAIWALLSVLEGYGLHLMTTEFAFVGNDDAPPLWLFFIMGGAINASVATFASYCSFTATCNKLAAGWPWKREPVIRPALTAEEREARTALMTAACELIDLNARIARVEGNLKMDATALQEKPQISAETRQRIRDAEKQVEQDATRLSQLLEYIARRMGILGPLMNMGEVAVPIKMMLLPFQKIWLHLRGEEHDHWPGT